jgi:hypothetical protein
MLEEYFHCLCKRLSESEEPERPTKENFPRESTKLFAGANFGLHTKREMIGVRMRVKLWERLP